MKKKHTALLVCLLALAALAGAMASRERLEIAGNWLRVKIGGGYSLADRLTQIGPAARERLQARFAQAGLSYPLHEIALVAIKDERRLELHARSVGGRWRIVHSYPVLGQSGAFGPKLREGDMQVPEGNYRVSFLNPNSLFHVALGLDYPNSFDREMAARDGRTNLGGDIMIHGKTASIGCLAMGDSVAEELFVAAADVMPRAVNVLVVPTDLRGKRDLPLAQADHPAWLPALYADLRWRIAEFPGR